MLIEALNDELISYTRYENNQIIYIDKEGKDYKVKNEITYSNWVKNYSLDKYGKDWNYCLGLSYRYDMKNKNWRNKYKFIFDLFEVFWHF